MIKIRWNKRAPVGAKRIYLTTCAQNAAGDLVEDWSDPVELVMRERYLRALNWMRDNRVPEHPFFKTLFDRRCRRLREYNAMLPVIRSRVR